jgi:hypothetical protein
MATVIKISEEQVSRFEEYVALQRSIKELSDQAAEIRAEIDQCVYDVDPIEDESVVIIVNDSIIEFSVVPKSFKFDYDIKEYIEETSAYDTLTVSSTEAKKILSAKQVDKYFRIEKGTRRIKIK